MTVLSVAGLEAEARAATGLTDFGPDTGWREGLVRLVNAVEAMNPPDQLRHIAQHNILGQLSTRLRFVEDDRKYPEIARQDVGAPLIVVGLPRTGTTISYDLLCLDPEARAALPEMEDEAAEFGSVDLVVPKVLFAQPVLFET